MAWRQTGYARRSLPVPTMPDCTAIREANHSRYHEGPSKASRTPGHYGTEGYKRSHQLGAYVGWSSEMADSKHPAWDRWKERYALTFTRWQGVTPHVPHCVKYQPTAPSSPHPPFLGYKQSKLHSITFFSKIMKICLLNNELKYIRINIFVDGRIHKFYF